MFDIPAANLLEIWEKGLGHSPTQRGLLLLAAAHASSLSTGAAELSIGQRDRQLLELRKQWFGPQLTSLATCPACGEQSELQFSTDDVAAGPGPAKEELLELKSTDYEMTFRLPNSLDLLKIAPDEDLSVSRRRLMARCLLSARRNGEEVTAEQLPSEAISAMGERMAQADPQADVQLALTCPQCAHQWQAPLDIVSFLWSEVHAWAIRLLREIHELASAYGWSEAEILALSPWRRRAYLELVNA